MARKLQKRQRGNISELLFKVEATTRGFQMCEPVCDTYRYDNVVQSGSTFWRTQVKSTRVRRGKDRYQANCSCGHRAKRGYWKSEVDFVAFHIQSTNTWYIVPIAALGRRLSVTLYGPSRREEGLFAAYYEAWHLLKQRRPCTFCLHASAETDSSNAQDPAQTPDEFPRDSGVVWEGTGSDQHNLDERNLRVMQGDDPDGLGIVLQGVVALG